MRTLIISLCLSGLCASTCRADAQEFIEQIRARISALDGEIEQLERAAPSSRQQNLERLWSLAVKLRERGRQRYYLAAEQHSERGSEPWNDPGLKTDLRACLEVATDLLALDPQPARAAEVIWLTIQVNRELGDYEAMLWRSNELLMHHAPSPQAAQALMLLGDFYFDRSELDRAADYYTRLVGRPDEVCEAMARYKLGWVAINQVHWREAMAQFERVARGPDEGPCSDFLYGRPIRFELVTEALVALTFCYTHVHPPGHALSYFSQFQMPAARAVRVYEKLADRLFILEQFPAAEQVYRHLLTLPADPERVSDWRRRLDDIALQRGSE